MPQLSWRNRYLTVALVLFTVAFASIWAAASYFGIGPSGVVSFHIGDGHCDPARQGLGVHCFSDFSIVREVFSAPDPWNAGPVSTTYPPLAWSPALVLAVVNKYLLGDGVVGLWGYLAVAGLCLLTPAIWAARRRPLGEAVQIVLLLAIGAAPVLALLDRGNTLAFAVPLVLLAGISFVRDRRGMLIVAIVFAALLKPQLILLVGLQLARRRYWDIVTTVVTTVLITVASFAAFWAHFPDNLFGWLRNLRGYNDYQGLDIAYPYNMGIGRSVVSLIDLGSRGAADPAFRAGTLSAFASAQTVTTFVVLAFGAWLLWFAGARVPRTYVLMLCVFLVLYSSAVVYSYYLALLLVPAAIILRDPDSSGFGLGALDSEPAVGSVLPWATIVVLGMVAAPIIIPTSAPIVTAGVHAALAGGVVSYYQIALGPVLLCYFILLVGKLTTAAFSVWRERRTLASSGAAEADA